MRVVVFSQRCALAPEGAVQRRRGLQLDRRDPRPRGEGGERRAAGRGQVPVPGQDAQDQGGLPLQGHVQQTLWRTERQLGPDSRVARLHRLQVTFL